MRPDPQDVLSPGPLADIRVVDCATLIAAPGCARHLADFGADVIKVERPGSGDGARRLGWRHPDDDTSLMWKVLSRNKRTVAIDLKSTEGHGQMLELCAGADVLVENFRPGTLERLGLGPDALWARNPKLVITRVTGFGQDGPYASRPGFATIAEALSGFTALNGDPDGAPLLPPVAVTDEVAGMIAAFATLTALHSGVGQIVDVSLLESMIQLLGPLPSARSLLGYEQPRLGAGLPYSVPRGTYCSSDGRWIALSTSSEPVADRFLTLIGLDDPELRAGEVRAERRSEIDEAVAAWIGARTADDVLDQCERADVAVAPVLTVGEMLEHPQVVARGVMQVVDGVPMTGPAARLSATPASIRWAGRALGLDQDDVLGLPDARAADPAIQER